MRGPVLLHGINEWCLSLLLSTGCALRLRCRTEVALLPVFIDFHIGLSLTEAPVCHFFLSRLMANRSTETITMVGPTVDVFKISVLIRNPTATETKLTADERTTNWAILPVS